MDHAGEPARREHETLGEIVHRFHVVEHLGDELAKGNLDVLLDVLHGRIDRLAAPDGLLRGNELEQSVTVGPGRSRHPVLHLATEDHGPSRRSVTSLERGRGEIVLDRYVTYREREHRLEVGVKSEALHVVDRRSPRDVALRRAGVTVLGMASGRYRAPFARRAVN